MRPTKEGWYWYRERANEEFKSVRVWSEYGMPGTLAITVSNSNRLVDGTFSEQWGGKCLREVDMAEPLKIPKFIVDMYEVPNLVHYFAIDANCNGYWYPYLPTYNIRSRVWNSVVSINAGIFKNFGPPEKALWKITENGWVKYEEA